MERVNQTISFRLIHEFFKFFSSLQLHQKKLFAEEKIPIHFWEILSAIDLFTPRANDVKSADDAKKNNKSLSCKSLTTFKRVCTEKHFSMKICECVRLASSNISVDGRLRGAKSYAFQGFPMEV